jgi:osmotically-inducible protein OsmY
METVMVQRFSNLDADEAAGRANSPGLMAAAVSSALSDAYDINASNIRVSMLGSYAILEGTVHNRGDIARAIEIAEEVAGVGKVRSRLVAR